MPRAVPIKPITGMFKKRIIRDVSIGIGGGAVAMTLFWKFCYGDRVNKTEAYFKAHSESQKQ